MERCRKYDLWPILENIMHNAEGFGDFFMQILQHLTQDRLINSAMVS